MAAEKEKLAVFMYFDADAESLETAICKNVLDVTSAAIADNVEIYVYLDRCGQDTRKAENPNQFDKLYEEWWKDAAGKEIQGGSMYGKVVKQKDGSFKVEWDASIGLKVRDSSLSSTLGDFMTWATDQTEASHYLVWMSDHGNGMTGGFTDSAIKENRMLPMQYADVLKNYSDELDVITFDCCLMANAEALAELNGVAKYVVASEQTINEKGLDYTNVFTAISKLKDFEDARTLAETIIAADTTDKSEADTLSSSEIDDTLLSALQEFGNASYSFTEEDWSALVDAFHNPNYYYSGDYADLIELLLDSAFTNETISQNLKDAVSALKDAAEDSVDIRKTAKATIQTQHGYGVTVYSPVRQQTEKIIKRNFAYMSMTQAGNDTPWADFLYQLYQKAKADDKVFRTMQEGTYVNQFGKGSAISLRVDETGYLVHDNEDDIGRAIPISLTDNGLEHDCNYVINQENFLLFKLGDTTIAPSDTYKMVFTFAPYMETTEIADGSITINVYEAKLKNKTYNLGKCQATYSNQGNSITVPVSYTDDEKYYVWQIVSDKAVSYSFEADHRDLAGNKIMAVEDRFDRELVQESIPRKYGHHSFDCALHIDNNDIKNRIEYIGALAVTQDTQDEVNTDYFRISSLELGSQTPCNLQITVTGVKSGTVKAGSLSVVLFDANQKKVAEAIETETGKYVFDSSVSLTGGEYLTVSSLLTDDDACYYNISHEWIDSSSANTEQTTPAQSGTETEPEQYYDGYIDSTSTRAITGKNNSYSLGWSIGHGYKGKDDPVTYRLQISTDDTFSTAFSIDVDNIAAKVYNVAYDLAYNWRVRTQDNDLEEDPGWQDGSDQLVGEASEAPRRVTAQNDFVSDIMMARADGTWQSGFVARNRGFTGTTWTGTREAVSITGKNKITDVFTGGGDDSAILVLTDDNNGDAVFVDDIYSALPEKMTAGSRLTNITTVYAGAGDDVLDFTSQRYSSQTVEKMVLHGGDGNDVLWTADTSSRLFGDAGNDKLTGSTKNDVLVGGSGDDTMYGCGGEEDIFCFCENWGIDTVFQEADSKVVLWFAKGKEENWDADTLTYTDGDNSVKVSGVRNADVELRFGEPSPILGYADLYKELLADGAFESETTSKIYENTLA